MKMRHPGRIWTITVFAPTLILAGAAPAVAQEGVRDLTHRFPPAATSDTVRMLQGPVKVQGTGGLCQDALYLVTHTGDREELFADANRQAKTEPLRSATWRYCSVFASEAARSPLMGRNWDNQNVGSIIVSLYRPPGGYASISFSRAIDLGLPLNLDLEEIQASELGDKLLLTPFYAMDGVNEHGLAVAVAGVRQATHTARSTGERVFVSYLIRKILDGAKSVDEARHLAAGFVPFDLDTNSLNGHLLIADASGRSVILEYEEDRWRMISPDTSWQVLSTKPIFGVPDAEQRRKCRRFRRMSEALEAADGEIDWRAGMAILQDVSQKGTTWSVVYALATRELYFTVYQDWETVYRLEFP